MTERVRDVDESHLLERIRAVLPLPARGSGPWDDAAVLRPTGQRVISTDAQIEGTHFQRTWITPEELGERALAVSLSDVAAMGAESEAVVLALVLPPDLPVSAVVRFHRGAARLARATHTVIAGGNLARGSEIGITVTAVGRLRASAWRRESARPGDVVLVLGQPGLAHEGLSLLQAGAPARAADLWRADGIPAWRRRLATRPGARAALRAWLRPRPLFDAARALRSHGVTSAIDVSDGLRRDLPRLAGSSLDLELVQPSRLAGLSHATDAARSFWNGGEDYGLLVTVRPRAAERILEKGRLGGVRVTRLGVVRRGSGEIRVDHGNGPQTLSGGGFDHFGS